MDLAAETLHAEHLGFEVVTIHLDALHDTDPSFEIWTLLSWLAARTSSIRVAPVVLSLPHRHLAVLAKMAETLDRLSDARLILVLGSDGPMNEPVYEPLASPSARRGKRWRRSKRPPTSFAVSGAPPTSPMRGQHFRTEGATIEPKPCHPIPL